MSEPVKQKDEATVQVPAKGLGTPGEGTEPQMPPGPNPELADDRKLVEMVSAPFDAAQLRSSLLGRHAAGIVSRGDAGL